MTSAATCAIRGSSPLTRGKHCRFSSGQVLQGLIPAHAGKTGTASLPSSRPRAHPRSRGENVGAVAVGDVVAGSSPLTRGKLFRPPGKRYPGRLIPAHAGKTAATAGPNHHARAHPRSRGENLAPMGSLGGSGGSSPLTRGKPAPRSSPLGLSGLIPAHAGKTAREYEEWLGDGAHPRSRGENYEADADVIGLSGSSPLTRGKLRPPTRHGA